MKINTFINESEKILQLEPDFEIIKDDILEDSDSEDEIDETEESTPYTEEYHLDGIKPDAKAAYHAIKLSLASYQVNPQHYYIAFRNKHNFVFIKFTKTKLKVIVMLPSENVEKNLKYHTAIEPSLSVQKFYNGRCTSIVVENTTNIQEVIDIVKKAAISDKVRIAKET